MEEGPGYNGFNEYFLTMFWEIFNKYTSLNLNISIPNTIFIRNGIINSWFKVINSKIKKRSKNNLYMSSIKNYFSKFKHKGNNVIATFIKIEKNLLNNKNKYIFYYYNYKDLNNFLNNDIFPNGILQKFINPMNDKNCFLISYDKLLL